MEGGGSDADLPEDPLFDGNLVLGEGSGLEELVDSVDWQETTEVGIEIFGDWDPNGMRRHHFVGEDFVSEDVPDFRRRIGADGNFHPQCLAHELSYRIGLQNNSFTWLLI